MSDWISVKDDKPKIGQTCAFVVDCEGGQFDNFVFGGRYQGDEFGPSFSTPGYTVRGKCWYPLEDAPEEKDIKKKNI